MTCGDDTFARLNLPPLRIGPVLGSNLSNRASKSSLEAKDMLVSTQRFADPFFLTRVLDDSLRVQPLTAL